MDAQFTKILQESRKNDVTQVIGDTSVNNNKKTTPQTTTVVIDEEVDDEFMRRKEGNLCFMCNKTWTAGHKCKERSLRVVILAEDEEVTEEGEIKKIEFGTESDKESEAEEDEELKALELSQMSTKGLTQPRTMKMIVIINGLKILVLISCGASHNFISPTVVKRLGLKVDESKVYKVRLGDGNRRSTQGKCKGVKFQIGDYQDTVDALIFELGGVDLILGVAWLATLGYIKANWKTLSMQFNTKQGLVEMKGDPSLGNHPVELDLPEGGSIAGTRRKLQTGKGAEVKKDKAIRRGEGAGFNKSLGYSSEEATWEDGAHTSTIPQGSTKGGKPLDRFDYIVIWF